MSEKKDRREYFKNYYKSLSDAKKEELRRKKREAYKMKKLKFALDSQLSSSHKTVFKPGIMITKLKYILLS